MKQQKMDRCLAAPAAEASQLCLGAAASMPTPKAVPAAYRIVIGVTPREHSIVAFLWAFKNLVRQNRNKAIIVLCDAYSETRHIAPLSCKLRSVTRVQPFFSYYANLQTNFCAHARKAFSN